MPTNPLDSASTSPDGSAHNSLFHVDRFPIMRRYIKHATLIENCFPYPATAASRPKSNELSYLVYYANSKPAKLAKVGVYLERKIHRELYKRRRYEVEICLEIFDALLKACRQDLNYFTKPILHSLWAIFAADHADLVPAATRTFTNFCRQHNGSTLGIDLRLRATYDLLIGKFSSFALGDQGTGESALRLRFIGLRAIHAVVTSEATRVTDSHRELEAVIPAVLANLTAPWLAPDDEKAGRAARWAEIEALPLADPPVTPDLISDLAWINLKEMIENSNGFNFRYIILQAVSYINATRPQWHPCDPIVELFTQMTVSLQPQYRAILVTELLQQLTQLEVPLVPPSAHDASTSSVGLGSTPQDMPGANRSGSAHDTTTPATSDKRSTLGRSLAQGPDVTTLLQTMYRRAPKKLCLVRLLAALLNGSFILVGLSVLEMLDILLRHLVVDVLLQDAEETDLAARLAARPALRHSTSLERFNQAINSPGKASTTGRHASQDGSGPPTDNSRTSDASRPPSAAATGAPDPSVTSNSLALGSVVLGSPVLAKSRSNLGTGSRQPTATTSSGTASGTGDSALIPVRLGDIITAEVAAVGGLGSHTYYAEQVADIVLQIMDELQLPDDSWADDSVTSNSSAYRERLLPHLVGGGDSLSPRRLGKLRVALLRALSSVLRANVEACMRHPNMLVATTTLGLVSPTLFLFSETNPNVRLHYVQFVIDFMYHQNTEFFRNSGILPPSVSTLVDPSAADGDTPFPLITAASRVHQHLAAENKSPNQPRIPSSTSVLQSRRASLIDIESRSQLHRALFHYATQANGTDNDAIGIGALFTLLLQRYTHEEFVLVLPILLKLQDFARELQPPARSAALVTMVYMYLLYAALMFEMDALAAYIQGLVACRKAVPDLWDPVVETCLTARTLEITRYHLFELVQTDSDTSTVRTMPSIMEGLSVSLPEVSGSVLGVSGPAPDGTEVSETKAATATVTTSGPRTANLYVNPSELFTCLAKYKQLLREYPDLEARLTNGGSGYPTMERPTASLLKQRTTRRVSSRSQIRASLNLDGLRPSRSLLGPLGGSIAGTASPSGVSAAAFSISAATPSVGGAGGDSQARDSNPPSSPTHLMVKPVDLPYDVATVSSRPLDHDVVRVENLREALYAQLSMAPDSSEPDTTDSDLPAPSHLVRGGAGATANHNGYGQNHTLNRAPSSVRNGGSILNGRSVSTGTDVSGRRAEVMDLLNSIGVPAPTGRAHSSADGGLLSHTPDMRRRL
ncbi:plasma membrane localization protein [Tieghemiomyces parasiticus]|uniref:Plasma membrane localization protein n=1 Tax=Tieghemiomyces parasiticus TaxID=78921 RepID=A0A9W8DY23_9FUNG|nr:plasma membrane localization protein [Tieghemiomyces parasiticus]